MAATSLYPASMLFKPAKLSVIWSSTSRPETHERSVLSTVAPSWLISAPRPFWTRSQFFLIVFNWFDWCRYFPVNSTFCIRFSSHGLNGNVIWAKYLSRLWCKRTTTPLYWKSNISPRKMEFVVDVFVGSGSIPRLRCIIGGWESVPSVLITSRLKPPLSTFNCRRLYLGLFLRLCNCAWLARLSSGVLTLFTYKIPPF